MTTKTKDELTATIRDRHAHLTDSIGDVRLLTLRYDRIEQLLSRHLPDLLVDHYSDDLKADIRSAHDDTALQLEDLAPYLGVDYTNLHNWYTGQSPIVI